MGRIDHYSIVLVLLSQTGKATAGSAIASIRSSFDGIHLVLIVGVCGGVPFLHNGSEIILGDVVIGKRVVPYDLGQQYSHGFKLNKSLENSLGKANINVSKLVDLLETDRGRRLVEARVAIVLRDLQRNAASRGQDDEFKYPGTTQDKLFKPGYRHKHYSGIPARSCICRDCSEESDPVCEDALNEACEDIGCDEKYLMHRERVDIKRELEQTNNNQVQEPAIHIGSIASGSKMMKSTRERDIFSCQENIIAFEVEGPGMGDELPCIVIKGVCDYADSHANKKWRNFAAATASSVAKVILERYIQMVDPPASHDVIGVANNDAQSEIQLHLAVEGGDGRLTQKLIRAGVDVNTKNKNGDSPLLVASKGGHERIVRFLLSCPGVIVDARNTIQATALIETALQGHTSIVRLLLDAGADVNAQNVFGNSPLSLAAEYEREETVIQILKHEDIDVSPKQQNGRTPLHWVAGRGNLFIMKLLLEAGANINAKDSNGDTPLSMARNRAVVRLLQPYFSALAKEKVLLSIVNKVKH